jgi:hypothetical protein
LIERRRHLGGGAAASASLILNHFLEHAKVLFSQKENRYTEKKTREFETPKQTMTLSSLSLSLEEIKSTVIGAISLGLATGRTSSSSSPAAFLLGRADLRCCCGIIYGMMMIVIERASERSSHCHGVKEPIRVHISAVLRKQVAELLL